MHSWSNTSEVTDQVATPIRVLWNRTINWLNYSLLRMQLNWTICWGIALYTDRIHWHGIKNQKHPQKAFESLKIAFLFVSISILVRDNFYLIVQRSLLPSSNYPIFLLFFRSRVPLILWFGALLALIRTPTRNVHFRCATITWLTFTTRDGHMTLHWPHFRLSLPKSQNGSISVNGHISWLTLWISINIGQPCCHDYTKLCMAMQGCVKAE